MAAHQGQWRGAPGAGESVYVRLAGLGHKSDDSLFNSSSPSSEQLLEVDHEHLEPHDDTMTSLIHTHTHTATSDIFY